MISTFWIIMENYTYILMKLFSSRMLRAVKNGWESLVYHRLYKRNLEDFVKKLKDEYDKILKDRQEHLDYVKQNLENSTPKFKLLQEKQAELKKSQIRCMLVKKKIEERQKINQLKTEIRKKIFYGDIIEFAQSWIERRNYLETEKKLEELTIQEREWMKKVMDSTAELHRRQKMRNLEKNTFKMPFEVI